MRRALELAANGRYSTSPNPRVGCVIVRDDSVLAEGWHRRAGEPHAEIEALRNCTSDPRGATMYVTLEPCAHHGRTPPCADAVIAAGISRVVLAMRDPNELVDGAGIRKLEAAGINVSSGILEDEARRLNEVFVHAVTRKRPFVLLKAGMTLDGKLASITRESQWITSPESRQASLALREEHDAIMVGSGTIAADDPQLTRRLGWSGALHPWRRIIVDGRGEVPPAARVLTDGAPTILFTSVPARYAASENLEVVPLHARDGFFPLDDVLRELHAREIRSVIVEGGSLLHSQFIRERLWQKLVLFIAPMVIGGADAPSIFGGDGVARLTDAYRFHFDRVERIGDDVMLTAYPLT